MIGLPTGTATDIWVVDCDGEQGKAAFQELCHQHGYTPDTLSQNTASGGCHYLFACPATPVKNSVSKLAPNVDVRGEGGYIIVAPSIKADGGRYVWTGKNQPVSAPEWLLALVCKTDAPATIEMANDTPDRSLDDSNKKKERNRLLARIASSMNQIARWANTYKAGMEAVRVIAALADTRDALKADTPPAPCAPDCANVEVQPC